MSTTSNSVIAELQTALTNSPNWEEGLDSIKNPSNYRFELSYDNVNYDITVTKLCPGSGEEMDFGSAIRCLKCGLKVARKGWHHGDKFLWFKPSATIRAEWCKDEKLRIIADENGGTIDGLGIICLYLTVDGRPTILTGWNPLPCDVLADDWVVVD